MNCFLLFPQISIIIFNVFSVFFTSVAFLDASEIFIPASFNH